MSQKDNYWIRRYELPNMRIDGFPQGWGIIVIDSKGFLTAVSDYGNYSHHWPPAFGSDFAEFVLRLDAGYLAGKFGVKDIYDGDATLKEVTSILTSYFSDKPEKLEEELSTLRQYSRLSHRDDFGLWLQQTELPDAHECYCQQGDPQFVGFMEHIWPRFKELLRAEYPRMVSTKVSSFQKHQGRSRQKRSLPKAPVLVREVRPSRPA